MKLKYILLLSLLAGVVSSPRVFAQSDIPATFDYTLETLRQSVSNLSQENQALNAQNLAMRNKVKAAEVSLSSLQDESKRLQVKRTTLLERERRKAGNVDVLKEELARLDDVLKKTRDSVGLEEVQIMSVETEVQALQQKLTASNAQGSGSDEVLPPFRAEMDSAKAAHEEAKKEFFDVANKLQEAKRQWEELNAAVTTGPKQLDALRAEQEALKQSVAGLEVEVTSLKAKNVEAKAVWDAFKAEDHSDLRFGRLESEFKELSERNRKVEVDLFAMQKTQDEKLKRMQEQRDAKRQVFQSKMSELSAKNQQLRQDLKALRQQMVTLDKKKAQLEGGIFAGH
ncbi:MAG: hypothetical protein HQL17_02090 [Candidatus Omnitrophica bacterium]|nr:hypothetical protein [Candidatus Omnitrophota bacterium]